MIARHNTFNEVFDEHHAIGGNEIGKSIYPFKGI